MYQRLNTEICSSQNDWIYPQVEHMGPGYRWDDPDAITHIIANKPLEFIPNMRSFHLSDKTRKTDLITQNYIYRMGLLASEAFRDLLKRHVVQAHEEWPAEVIYRGEAFAYTWFHMTEEVEDYINYPKSDFVIRRPSGSEEALELQTSKVLRSLAKELLNSGAGVLAARRITLVSEAPHFDLFCLCLNSFEFFVSEQLGKELEQLGLSGFELEPSDAAIVFDERPE